MPLKRQAARIFYHANVPLTVPIQEDNQKNPTRNIESFFSLS